ncbi:helix-turn-helix domain-containing protein [Streptomyces sp. NPDC059837]|uniref:helix-turn-helix domain-containing protein n=1 Tax=unclassified Streptomyces TaxID=2593676 RepID=UPI002B1D5F97|nr:helix-turn-helix domain-containing protein [Streptomyces sp. NBC_00268]
MSTGCEYAPRRSFHAARGYSNTRIARETGLSPDTFRAWRGRFAQQGLAGLVRDEYCIHTGHSLDSTSSDRA